MQDYVEKMVKQGDNTLQARYELILEQKQFIQNQINNLNLCLKEFEYKEWYYKTAIESGTEKVVENVTSITPTLDVDKIPKDFKKEVK